MSDKFSIAHDLLQRLRAVTCTVAKVSDGNTIQIITPDGTDLIRQFLCTLDDFWELLLT